ncbi:transporter substrate-binding domain-containing protein [Ornithinimicrobium cerasi]|uniref:transporter substrate-binding domain-containing protein n=1 Tax=Ornithinimicrobium cerasi TaxID=2248773 RepID=UPI000EFF8B66|nr:transporter substrate-binding domain-containing protein [Ornithinimicrobium cerasi]
MASPPARARVLAAGLLSAALLGGCGVSIPTDPDGTLNRVRTSGELRVGVSPHPPFTTLPATPDGEPGGTEVELVEQFARAQGAEPEYVVEGEEELVRLLEEGELDVVVGGLTSKSPWSKKVGLTRPYLETSEHGRTVKHVMAVVRGENLLMSELERFLDEEAR